jgi:hypothetical protein
VAAARDKIRGRLQLLVVDLESQDAVWLCVNCGVGYVWVLGRSIDRDMRSVRRGEVCDCVQLSARSLGGLRVAAGSSDETVVLESENALRGGS